MLFFLNKEREKTISKKWIGINLPLNNIICKYRHELDML